MKSKLFLGTSAGFIGAVVMAVLVKDYMVGTLLGSTIGLIAHLICGYIIGLGILIALDSSCCLWRSGHHIFNKSL